jgi:signal transduction histidine kinase
MLQQEAALREADDSLVRVVLGWRLFSLAWMIGLVIETLVSDDRADRQIVVAAAVVAVAWTGLTLWVARDRARFRSMRWLVADGAVVSLLGLAPVAADSESTFYGGYLLSWVIYVAYVSGPRWLSAGAFSAGIMSVSQGVDEVYRQDSWNVVGDIAVFFVTAWVVGGGMWSIRHNEALRISAEQELAEERAVRRRSDERAELAARLHDTVLQTLPVIRLRAGDPESVAELARRVERQLRQFLERLRSDYSDGFRAAMRNAAWDVEDLYNVTIEAEGSGDCDLDDRSRALIAAAREAMINAAKHSGAAEVALYSEIRDGTIRVFVRDRGVGFDTRDRQMLGRGLSTSVVGRMDRLGGRAEVRSTPGEGTEIELVLTPT